MLDRGQIRNHSWKGAGSTETLRNLGEGSSELLHGSRECPAERGGGLRTAMPVSRPASSGSTFPTAFAAPVDAGMRLLPAPRPERQSFPPFALPSTVTWEAVTAWIDVIRPCGQPGCS